MLAERGARGPQRLPCDTLQRRVCGACRREGLAQELQHTLSPVRSARPGGGGGGETAARGAASPARPAHRESVVYVERNLSPLEGELLLPVPAHCHQSRHRPRRCRCHRHHLLPAAAAAAAAPAAAASSQLLPATAKPRERKHPPPRSTFATGGKERSRRAPESGTAFPITRFHTRAANQRRAAPGPAPSRLSPSPAPTPAGLQSGSKGETEETRRSQGFPSPSLESQLQDPTHGLSTTAHRLLPTAGKPSIPLTPSSPFLERPAQSVPRAAVARHDPAPGRGRPRLGSAESVEGGADPFLTLLGGDLSVLTFTVFVVASLTPTSAPRYRLTRPASGPAWAGARLRMPFPLQDQSAARATGSGGGRAGDVGGWGREGPRALGGAPLPLARLQTDAPGSSLSKLWWRGWGGPQGTLNA